MYCRRVGDAESDVWRKTRLAAKMIHQVLETCTIRCNRTSLRS
jgi:hypothetical protein